MSLFRRFFRQPKIAQQRAEQLAERETTSTGKMPQSVRVAPMQTTRHYLENSDYQLPKDAEEDSRLNFQHHALFHAIGNHYVAPINPPQHMILDVGTGTGIWANEMAKLFPASFVVGIDISASSFRESTPDNCLLRMGNVLTGLPFPDALFSFTHQRLLMVGITGENWPRAVRELVRVTRRNGWVELVEAEDHVSNGGPANLKMVEILQTVTKRLGFDEGIIRHLGDLLMQEKLQRVEMQSIRVPVGDWGGRVGSMMKRDILSAASAIKGNYARLAGVTEAEFDQLVSAVAQEWETYHSYIVFYAAYGKRGMD